MKLVVVSAKVAYDALEWAKENCPGYITNDLHQDGYNTFDNYYLDFFFADNSDSERLMFELKFGCNG